MSGDLPSDEKRVTAGAQALLVEATGTGKLGPGLEYHAATINLYSADKPSVGLSEDWVIRNSDGTLPRSCERWLRLRFSPPFGAISGVRFWSDNYSPTAGWEVNWGLLQNYRKPSYNKSSVATRALPTSDPGFNGANITMSQTGVFPVGNSATLFSDWIVIQATWQGVAVNTIQTTPINLCFAWREA